MMELRKAIDSSLLGLVLAFSMAPLFLGTGCRSRVEHVRRADRDAYFLIQQKSCGKPWEPPSQFSIIPNSNSRMAIRGCLVHPCLPGPTTSLYAYNLPLLRSDQESSKDQSAESEQEEAEQPVGRPIPPDAWEAIPAACLKRMVDFESIRSEANYTGENYEVEVMPNSTSDSRKLTLEDVVDLAILNSRSFQTQKENLYLTALQLSQERFNYQCNFRRTGNGFDLGFDHFRAGGITQNNLGIPSGVGMSRALVTGGDVLASFANNILLTFNGTDGFSKDISSRILLDFVQPLIQRDIQFESLTQAERNLVYAARDFARFRKEFFVSFASDYYDLIRSFRQIEIDSQNYFSLVRAFNQAEQEFLAGLVPRFQVDQVEQSLLNGRGRLIGTCNQVEQSLDSLKLSLGIPTETPINVDLQELNELTRLDQLSVASDSAARVVSRLQTSLINPDRLELLSTAAVLVDRIINAAKLSGEQENESEIESYLLLRQRYLVDYARLTSEQIQNDLTREIESDSPSPSVILQRSLAHCESLVSLVERQLDYAATLGTLDEAVLSQFAERREEYAGVIENLDLQPLVTELRMNEMPELLERAEALRKTLAGFIDEIDQFVGFEVAEDPETDLSRIISEASDLVQQASKTLAGAEFGLQPIEIDPDDAMLTALVLRFDLMNQRESLADDWRQIKLAADNLKAILDVSATQIISTDSNASDPFNFTLDDSSTALGLNFDAPLNRFLERNAFRAELIDYQRGLRNLALLEDNIKFSIRNDLRSLALDREQYLIAVASAALAYERVVSTSLEFRLGTGGVTARDFLEAQTAYTDALSNVASRHIDYIVDRSLLFLDLELLYVDENGFWTDIRNEGLQPEPVYNLPPWAFPVYGKLPNVCYSKEMLQMHCYEHSAVQFPVFMEEVDTSSVDSNQLHREDASLLQMPSDETGVVTGAEEFELVQPGGEPGEVSDVFDLPSPTRTREQ